MQEAKTAKAPRLTQADRLIKLLKHKRGASMLEITGALGILAYSARALISVTTGKRGLTVETVGKAHYRIIV